MEEKCKKERNKKETNEHKHHRRVVCIKYIRLHILIPLDS